MRVATKRPDRDILDEWCQWRGKVVRYRHHTYCDHDRGVCRPAIVHIEYVIVGGYAADYIRAHSGRVPKGEYKDDYLVLVPITQDSDEDSYELVKREDIVA